MSKKILVLNAGSSSLKFASFDAHSLAIGMKGQISGIGTKPVLEALNSHFELPPDTGFGDGLAMLVQWLEDNGLNPSKLAGVGHRIVHGGTKFVAPTVVNAKILDELDTLRALAPLHLPFGLGVLRNMFRLRPHVPHVACFDTAFHMTQPELATRLPLPRSYFDRGYRRYGFHGLNYEHVVAALPLQTAKPLPKKLLIAHLGSGASMCGVLNGKSVATTMGFSTADGLVMGTRTGSIDPGVIVALLRDDKLSIEALEDLLYRRSGLLGLSGISPDMQVLLQSEKPEATEAVDYYCYSAARHAASLVPTLGGLDAVVFTGGIGENAAPVRNRIMKHLDWLGVQGQNVHVVAANEELTMARHVAALIG